MTASVLPLTTLGVTALLAAAACAVTAAATACCWGERGAGCVTGIAGEAVRSSRPSRVSIDNRRERCRRRSWFAALRPVNRIGPFPFLASHDVLTEAPRDRTPQGLEFRTSISEHRQTPGATLTVLTILSIRNAGLPSIRPSQ